MMKKMTNENGDSEGFGITFNAVDAIEVETIGDLIDLVERYLE